MSPSVSLKEASILDTVKMKVSHITFLLALQVFACLTDGFKQDYHNNIEKIVKQAILTKLHSFAIPKSSDIDGNAYIDEILEEARDQIKANGNDPYKIFDLEIEQVRLEGFIGGFSTIHRVSDAQVTETKDLLSITNTVRVVNWEGDLNWTTTFTDVDNYHGDADVMIDSVDLYMELVGAIEESSTEVYLNITALDIQNIGRISVEVHGFGILDEVIDVVNNVIFNLVKILIPRIFDGIAKVALQDVLDKHSFPLPTA